MPLSFSFIVIEETPTQESITFAYNHKLCLLIILRKRHLLQQIEKASTVSSKEEDKDKKTRTEAQVKALH